MTLASLVAHHLERQVSWGPVSEALSVREIFNTGQSYYQKELVQRVGILRCFANQCLLFSWSKRDLRFVVKFLWLWDMRQIPPLLLRPKLHHFCSSCYSDHCCSLLITLLGLTLVLPPPVALETEHVLPDRPALLPLHPRVQHHPAVLRVAIVSTNVVVICWGYILIPTSHLKHCGWKSLSSAWIREAWKIQCHRVVTISGKLPTGTIERLFKNERGNKNHFDSFPNSHGFPEWQFLNKYSCPPPWSDPPSAQLPSCKRYSERQTSLCNPDNDDHDDHEEE